MRPRSPEAICYGLRVRKCDLVAAGRVYLMAGPALNELDRIIGLRNRGALSVARYNSALAQVPGEVWRLVRDAVVHSVMVDARLELMYEPSCDDCRQADIDEAFDRTANEIEEQGGIVYYDELRDETNHKVYVAHEAYRAQHVWDKNWLDYAQKKECTCDSDEQDPTDLEYLWEMEFHSTWLYNLLQQYGLDHPQQQHHAAVQPAQTPSAATTVIGILNQSTATPASANSTPSGPGLGFNYFAHLPTAPKLTPAHTASFALPADVDARFRRLLRDFGFEPAERGGDITPIFYAST